MDVSLVVFSNGNDERYIWNGDLYIQVNKEEIRSNTRLMLIDSSTMFQSPYSIVIFCPFPQVQEPKNVPKQMLLGSPLAEAKEMDCLGWRSCLSQLLMIPLCVAVMPSKTNVEGCSHLSSWVISFIFLPTIYTQIFFWGWHQFSPQHPLFLSLDKGCLLAPLSTTWFNILERIFRSWDASKGRTVLFKTCCEQVRWPAIRYENGNGLNGLTFHCHMLSHFTSPHGSKT